MRLLALLCAFASLSACGSESSSVATPDTSSDADAGAPDAAAEAEVPEAAPPFDYCEPDTPPDAACFASKRDPSSEEIALARAIADKVLEDRPAAEQKWDWGEAVMMQGIAALWRVTGDAAYIDYLKAWMDAWIDKGFAIQTSDTCAPAALAVILYEETGDERYRTVVEDALYYLDEVALRTAEGGLNHLGVVDALGITLWVDSLFMFGNVLLRWYELEGDAAAIDELAAQFRIFGDVLQDDPGPGFYFHAYQWAGEQDPGIYWARGNAWVTAAGYDFLRVLENAGREDAEVRADLERQVAAVRDTQDAASGLWWTVLNRPGETYLETSASALFAFGLVRGWRYGLLPESDLDVARAALAGVRDKIVADEAGRPEITGISGPTTAGDFANYAAVSVASDISYGVGAVLLMLTELSGLPEPSQP